MYHLNLHSYENHGASMVDSPIRHGEHHHSFLSLRRAIARILPPELQVLPLQGPFIVTYI